MRIHYTFIVGIVALVLLPFWTFLISPAILSIPDDFIYDAFVISKDNFYDEQTEDFSGEIFSNTIFTYDVIDMDNGVLIINNLFDVRTFEGEEIFSVSRTYGVDPRTGKHVPGYGDSDREGYLFAPRSPDDTFIYWHINYDTPATMIFQEETEIGGLKVYRYEADYHADQTNNLGHLPGVPEERGINLDINLQLWIEPISGYLVNYMDNTTAYYYNIDTGERIHPWNAFSNTYNQISVERHTSAASTKKTEIIILKYIVPAIILIISGLLLIVGYMRRRQ